MKKEEITITDVQKCVARKITTPWRDANVRERGERFNKRPIVDDSERTVRYDREGNKTVWRGMKPYGGG